MNERLNKIKLLIMDVDGVLTDGKIVVDGNGIESKNFDVQDGMRIVLAHKAGLKTAIVSARDSAVVKFRAQDLKIDKVFVGVYPKTAAYEQIIKELGIKDEEVCFVGDDLVDIVVMKRVGFAVAVSNAAFEVKQIAHHVTQRAGGDGAVKEVIELILKSQGKWTPELYEI